MYLLNSAQFWALALCLQVCQHLPSVLEMFICVSRTSKEHLVHGTLTEAEILTSPFPMYLLNSAQFWILALSPQLCQHLPSSLQIFLYVSQEPPKILVHASTMRSNHNSISEVPTPDPLGVCEPVPDPRGSCSST